MIRHRNSPRPPLLAAPVLAALSAAALSSLPNLCRAETRGAPPRREWFRDDVPADPLGAAPAAAAVADPAPPAPAAAPAADPAAPAAPVAPAAPAAPAAQPADVPRRPAFPGNYGGFGNYSPYTPSYNDYPSAELYGYVVAQARAATARAMLSRAETELSLALRNAQHDFENSQVFKDAVRDERLAYDELNAARRRALRGLADDVKYQRLAALHRDLADQLLQRRAAHDILLDEILAIATLKMNYAVDMRAMEADALRGDGGAVKEAQDKLVAAGTRVSALRVRYDDSLRANVEVVSARRNLEDARIAKITTEAYLNAAANSGSEALDYAYYLHRRRGYYADYGSGYGGYGYGTR